MNELQADYRTKIFGNLLQAVEKHALGQGIEVRRDDATSQYQFAANKSSPRKASCTVALLPDQPTFQAHFGYGTGGLSLSAIAFNVSRNDARVTVPAATRVFPNVDEAAQWLITLLCQS
jgi:hypothetical protein